MRRKPVFLVALAAVAVGALPFAAGGTAAKAQAVSVTLKDFRIVMPKKLQAGPTTFTVRNIGKFSHDLRVVFHGQGTQFKIPKTAPGKTRTMSVNLKPGGYVVVCDVFNGYHASQGMVAAFSVGTLDFKTGKWSA